MCQHQLTVPTAVQPHPHRPRLWRIRCRHLGASLLPPVDPTLTAVQDGEEFLYITSLSKSLFSGWWDALSAAWRYGPLSPYRTSSAVGAMLRKFSNFYNPKWLIKHGAARSIEEFIDRVDLGRDLTTVKGDEWALKTVGVSEKWMGEIMEGSTRVNVSHVRDHDVVGC